VFEGLRSLNLDVFPASAFEAFLLKAAKSRHARFLPDLCSSQPPSRDAQGKTDSVLPGALYRFKFGAMALPQVRAHNLAPMKSSMQLRIVNKGGTEMKELDQATSST
jgi:hypothetical protein